MGEIVETTYGKVEGTERDGIPSFRGIPFAKPPVGELRWRTPRRGDPWKGVRDASRFGPEAPQLSAVGSQLTGTTEWERSEDCLYLNVWAPPAATSDGGGRPVMVWIHGGALVTGAGSNPAYHGQRIVKRGDIVLVTINYRLGALGLISHPSLTDEETGFYGNYALHDQIAALEWVRENIEAFGGDPGNVTIFGESAGGLSVSTLLGIPRARGLFHKAIAQSGFQSAFRPEAARETAERFASEFGLTGKSIGALRELSVEKILEVQPRFYGTTMLGSFGSFAIDGKLIEKRPTDSIAEGCSKGVPVIAGTNKDEAKFFLTLRRNVREVSDEQIHRTVEGRLSRLGEEVKVRAEEIVEAYRTSREERGAPCDQFEMLSAIESDLTFRLPTLRVLEAHSSHTPQVFSYLFTWESSAFEGRLGSCHALEIPFVFGRLDRAEIFTGPVEEPDFRLSQRMQDAWLAFARTGDPAHPDLVEWPRYDAARRATMIFDRECRVEEGPMEQERLAWEIGRPKTTARI